MYKNRAILYTTAALAALVVILLMVWPSSKNSQSTDTSLAAIDRTDANLNKAVENGDDRSVMTLLGALEQRVNEETKKRQQLEQKIARVQQNLQKLAKRDKDLSAKLGDEINQLDATTPTTVEKADTNVQLSQQDREREALTTVGLNQNQIESLQKSAESQEMAQLFLRNKAIREGWYGTERYFTENNKLESQMDAYKSTLGDDKYDRFLYLSGQANRVLVQSVLAGSPAEKAGLQTGDVVYQYDNKRIFSWNELTSATTKGQSGEMVPLTLLRNKQKINVYVPRGPIGIRLESDRVNPG